LALKVWLCVIRCKSGGHELDGRVIAGVWTKLTCASDIYCYHARCFYEVGEIKA